MKAQLIIQHVLRTLLFAAVVSAVPLMAEDTGSIQAALNSHNYDRAIALTKQAFANVKTAKDAGSLIRSVLSSAPASQSGALVVAAIDGNPGLAKAILSAAVADASKEQATTIFSSVYDVMVQNASRHFMNLGGDFIGDVLTMPFFNPENTVAVGNNLSPTTPVSKP
jgi:hypothetical protein